jgi:membrane-bound serine protease (ClpP class)
LLLCHAYLAPELCGAGAYYLFYILFILEIKVTSYGVLGIGGAVALALGSIMLIRTESALEIIRISWTLILGTTVLTLLFFSLLLALVVRGQMIKPVSGVEGMIGAVGETLDVLQPVGMIRIHGELWRAESGGEMIAGGQKVRVTAVKNLTLLVELV